MAKHELKWNFFLDQHAKQIIIINPHTKFEQASSKRLKKWGHTLSREGVTLSSYMSVMLHRNVIQLTPTLTDFMGPIILGANKRLYTWVCPSVGQSVTRFSKPGNPSRKVI